MSGRGLHRRKTIWLLPVVLAMGGCGVRSLIYPVPAVEVGAPPVGFEALSLVGASSTDFLGWFHSGPAGSDRPAMVFFHGNGENLETLKWSGLYERLIGLDLPTLVVEYPGYGAGDGVPSEDRIKQKAQQALAALAVKVPQRPIVVCGWSLGAAVAVHLAATRPTEVGGLIAVSPWTSLPAVARAHFPGWLVSAGLRERYDSLALAGSIRSPTLVIHGGADRIIPVEQGRRLSAATADARWLMVEEAGHNDLLGFSRVWMAIDEFVSNLSAPDSL